MSDCHKCATKPHCKNMCRSCYERNLRENNPEYAKRQRANSREWRKKNPDRVKALQDKRLKDPKCRKRDARTKKLNALKRVGLTKDSATLLLQEQGNSCAICKRDFSECTRHLDHCHETGKARGYLCSRCNNGLGMLGDNLEGLQTALRYLDKPPAASFVV